MEYRYGFTFFNLVARWGLVVNALPRPLYPRERAGTHCKGPYHLHVPIVLKSGSLNFLEPSGPDQACNGIALLLPLPIVKEAGCAPGPVWTGAENLATTGIRYPDRPARSESLHRLSYPGPQPQHSIGCSYGDSFQVQVG